MTFFIKIILTLLICSNFFHVTAKKLLPVQLGIDRLCSTEQHLIIGKKIGLITNQTGVDSNGNPNIDCLQKIPDSTLQVIFSPEHGFKGNHPAGKKINEKKSTKNIPIISLYGTQKKPTPDQLKGLDILIYDIQDIGARCYTYITTLGLAMEAAAEANIPFMVLDRPNPITTQKKHGPTLDLNFKSFIGYYPIKLRYGLTAGELAKLIIEKKWIKSTPTLTVISAKNLKATQWYDETSLPWIPPSPNIPDIDTALIYTATVIFESTNVSEGRGTNEPFLTIGAPWINGAKLANEIKRHNLQGIDIEPIRFVPKSQAQKAKNPKYLNTQCEGIRIIVTNRKKIHTEKIGKRLLTSIKKLYPTQLEIDEPYLNKLWGTDELSNLISKQTAF